MKGCFGPIFRAFVNLRELAKAKTDLLHTTFPHSDNYLTIRFRKIRWRCLPVSKCQLPHSLQNQKPTWCLVRCMQILFHRDAVCSFWTKKKKSFRMPSISAFANLRICRKHIFVIFSIHFKTITKYIESLEGFVTRWKENNSSIALSV